MQRNEQHVHSDGAHARGDTGMSQNEKGKSASRRFAPTGILFAALGLLLFVYFVRKAGVAEIINDIRALGAAFIIVLALSGCRFVVRALAWTMCFEPPHALRLRDAFRAYLTGDALGNILPLGIVVSEPAKAALVRDRVPLVAGLSAIAVENIFYSLSVALFVFGGALALLASFPLSNTLRGVSIGILVGVIFVITLAGVVMNRQWKILSGLLERLYVRGVGRRFLPETRRERVRSLEQRIYGFYERNRARFLPILLLEASFHLAGVAEVFVTLYFISDSPPTFLTAFVLESVNRVINVVFKFVPMRVGVDEAGTGLITGVLQLGTATGVTLAIIRKARMLCWTAIGVALLVGRGLSLGAVAGDAEQAVTAEMKQKTQRSEVRG
ncbi:MAG TPA: lysylphosphatidylglycerol synthase transmembrane domain-containing protein [Pyrinomonadaceae bacterium]|jgi:hypothetical protein